IARVTAQSTWNSSGCVAPGTPMATATSELADAQVLTGTPAASAVAALDNADGATVYTRSLVDLVDVPGRTNKGVRSVAMTQLTGVTLFKGTANQLTVNVLAPPVVTAFATGSPGGAGVTYSEPILQVVDHNGIVLGELDAATAHI